jgi:required for meiotic nuclear division protein 1
VIWPPASPRFSQPDRAFVLEDVIGTSYSGNNALLSSAVKLEPAKPSRVPEERPHPALLDGRGPYSPPTQPRLRHVVHGDFWSDRLEATDHSFHAVAFAENLALKDLAPSYPEAKRTGHELRVSLDERCMLFVYPFGAVVFCDVPTERRDAELARLVAAAPALQPPVVLEEMTVREDAGARRGVVDGVLTLDRLTVERAGVVSLVVAQSAAMEYYERIVEKMFTSTESLVDRLERRGTVPLRTRPLHRFIGTAIGTRSEVLAVLHLLDKPDATWDDPAMDQIFGELRREFDLADRFTALELKLRSVQEALELVLDVARDRRLVLLETAIVLLIALEIVMSFAR